MLKDIWLGTEKSLETMRMVERMQESGELMKLASGRTFDENEERIGSPLLQVSGPLAVVSVEGSLDANYAWYHEFMDITSYEAIRDAIMMAVDDPQVKGIVLAVDSGGGTPIGLEAMSKYISYVDSTVKPVYGHIMGAAHSAAYWLISATRRISADTLGSSGSIGVITYWNDTSKMYEQQGITRHYLRSGRFKALGGPGEKLSQDLIDDKMETVNELYDMFENQVVSARPELFALNSGKWEEGKTYFASKSLDYGLIDAINTFDDLVSALYDSANKGYSMSSQPSDFKVLGDYNMLKLLTQEQAAKLESGIPLESLGLSTGVLAKVQKELADKLKLESESSTVGESEPEGEDSQEGDGEPDGGEGEAQLNSDRKDSTLEKLLSVTSELALTNSKLEASEALLASNKSELETMSTLQSEFVTLLTESANRMGVVVGKSSAPDGLEAKACIAHYKAIKDELYATISPGQASSDTPSSASSDNGDEGFSIKNTIIPKK